MNKYDEASINTLAGGKAVSMFNAELVQALANCCDVNKDKRTKRTVTLKVELIPNEDLDGITTKIKATSTLAGDAPAVDHILMSQSGQAYVNNAHQLDIMQQIENGEVEKFNEQTGEQIK